MTALCMSFITTIAGKYIIDATTSGSLSWRYISFMAGSSLFTIVFSAGSHIFSSYINELFSFGMRSEMFDRIQRSIWKELSELHSGDIVTRLTSDISNISSGLISIIPSMVVLAIRLLISFCILLYFDKWLAIFALFIAPIGAISTLIYRKNYRYYQTKIRESESEYRSFMQEKMFNIEVVKTFQQEASNNQYLQEIRKKRMTLIMKSSKLSALMSSIMKLIYRSGYVIAFCWSAYRISTGEISYGTMTVFLSLVSQVQGSVSSLGSIIPQLYSMLVSAKRITDIVDIRDEDYQDFLSQPTHITVQMKNVTYAYDKQNILENVSFCVNAGDKVGIVGPSGAGKTTIVRLLLSLVTPDDGEVIFIDEKESFETAQPASRRFISYVPQGNTLFSGTIESNLRVGKSNATEEELWSALKIADADTFVKNAEDGLDTVLSEKGGGLSEGQAQRIAIARALLRNKPLLILDEATSALDEDTERRILSNISKSCKNTCFIVTHRKSMLPFCNKVLEINGNGSIKTRE